MKERVKFLFDRLKQNKLISNFFYLSTVQVFSLVLPLVVTPYLVRVLGLELFGLVTFAQSVMLLLYLVVDYGFNISATRFVSVNRDSPELVSRFYSNVLCAKLVLVLISFAILLFLLLFPTFNSHYSFFLSSFIIVLGQAFLPSWVYQGIEKIKEYSIISVISRMLYLLLIILLIKEPKDFLLVNILWGASFLISSIISIVRLKTHYFISLRMPSFSEVKLQLTTGVHIFFTSLSISVYTYSNSTILGIFVSYEAVGLYGIAERVMMILKQAPILFSQVLFPAGCKAAAESIKNYHKLLRNSYFPFLILFTSLCFIAFYFTPEIVGYFYHSHNVYLQNVVRMFIAAVFITTLNIPAYQTLLSFNFQKSYSYTYIGCCLISLIINVILTKLYGLSGTTANVFLTEVLVTVSLYVVLHTRHHKYSFFRITGNS